MKRQLQRESVMNIVKGADTALSTNMLISDATEALYPATVFEMVHHDETTKTHMKGL